MLVNFYNKSLYTPSSPGNSISFQSGQVTLYSDFDKTYLPCSQDDINKIQNSSQMPNLAKYFDGFANFLGKAGTDFKFILTTGRNFGEFKSFLNNIRDKNFQMPLPDSIITKNGGDEFIKINKSEEFYSDKRLNAFSINSVNQEKLDNIRILTKWDGDKITAKIINILRNYDFQILISPTTHSQKDYQDKTSRYILDKFPDDNSPRPWIAILRQDGNLNIHITLPKDMNYKEDRFKVKDSIIEDITAYLDTNDVNYQLESRFKDKEANDCPAIVITPKINGDPLTKKFDIKMAIEKAKGSNDLVIVAGDSSNDKDMLNLFNYLDLPDNITFKRDIEHQDIESITEFLKTHPEVQKKIDDLPVIGIVVRGGKNQPISDELASILNKGNHKKIYFVEQAHLLDGVRQAITDYSSKNNSFKINMSNSLLREIKNTNRN